VKPWRIWVAFAVAAATLALLMTWLARGAPPARAQAPQQTLPPSHLGYGINVRSQDVITSLFAPLGFEWLKLWEEYGVSVTVRYPYQVLFLVDCTRRSGDLVEWGDHVQAIAEAGRGLIEAYEICNEPNRRGWLNQDASPDPALYVQMLQVAYARIEAADPAAIVVSAGLAPVGRIQGNCNGWNGNDCGAMDEREYARQMFLRGAGDSFDAFGYHPYGFAYEPESDPNSVSNGFAFRGAEVMRGLLDQYGLGRKPVWVTEFGWLRDPSYDPGYPGWVPGGCHLNNVYRASFEWMDVPEAQQADYLTRAFQYADEHWPWMGAMFVWNLDWHDYNWLCEPARYFSVRKDDGMPLGAPALAYGALAALEKRPGSFGPRLAVEPAALTFLADVDEPGVFTGSVAVLNAGYRVLTWTAAVAPGMPVTPTLAISSGLQGAPLTVTVDSTGYATGTFTGNIDVMGLASGTLDSPFAVPVTLLIVPEVYHVYLPLALR
jgi:hypothetical protein